MALRVMAQSIECDLEDDEELSSVFIRWGPQGSYFGINREKCAEAIYCEANDQANGAVFKTITYSYLPGVLVFSVTYPEIFVAGVTSITIDLSGIDFNELMLVKCLERIFDGGTSSR